MLSFGLFGSGGNDDTHITYWAAHTLAEHGGIFNYNGERFEQSSSLATVVLLGALRSLPPIGVPTLGYLLSMVSALFAVVLCARLADILEPESGAGVMPIVATLGPLLYWASSGMEAALAAAATVALPLLASALERRRDVRTLSWSAVALLLFASVRPENVVVLPCVMVALLVWGGVHARRERSGRPLVVVGVFSGLSIFAIGAVFGFRKLYFGTWFPGPVYAKAATHELTSSALYLWGSLRDSGFTTVPLVMAGLALSARRAFGRREHAMAFAVGGALVFAQLAFVLASPGDWMGMARFLVPVLPLAGCLGWITLQRWLTSSSRWVVVTFVAGANLAAAVDLVRAGAGEAGRAGLAVLQTRARLRDRIGPDFDFAWIEQANSAHLRDLTLLPRLLAIVDGIRRERPNRRVVLFTGQAGMVPFYVFREHFGAVRLIDAWQLTERSAEPCIEPGGLRRTMHGTQLGRRYLMANLQRFRERCGVERPDVVHGVGVPRADGIAALRRDGYVVIHTQVGTMKSYRSEPFRRSRVLADSCIAVDSGLAQRLRLEPKHYHWDLAAD